MITQSDWDLIKIVIDDSVKEAKQEVYREISDSLKLAGDMDYYNYMSIEEQAAKSGCTMAGECISWLVED